MLFALPEYVGELLRHLGIRLGLVVELLGERDGVDGGLQLVDGSRALAQLKLQVPLSVSDGRVDVGDDGCPRGGDAMKKT